MGQLTGKTAIVTGASSGIGEAVVRRFAQAGAQVVIAARRMERLEALAKELGDNVLPIATDVAREDQVEQLFAETIRLFGRLDLLVANAGIADSTPIEEMSLERWSHVIDANLTSTFLCSRAAFQQMKAQNGGRIIIVGSISARVPRNTSPAYTASKFAVDGLTHSLALDGRQYGITAGVLHPGSTITELAPGMKDKAPSSASMDADNVAEVITCMAAMPATVNVFETVMLPIAQPFLARG
jgi:NAD(P)-dependent dehydrogenase (short-subunit alcohol dehydrogenase family)